MKKRNRRLIILKRLFINIVCTVSRQTLLKLIDYTFHLFYTAVFVWNFVKTRITQFMFIGKQVRRKLREKYRL